MASCQFSTSNKTSNETTIPSPSYAIGFRTAEIKSAIHEAQQTEPGPGNGRPGRLYLPSAVRPKVIHWVHTTKYTCHPGVKRIIA